MQRFEQSCRASDGEQLIVSLFRPQAFKRLHQSLWNLCRSENQSIFLHLVLCEQLILYFNICVYLYFSQEEYVSEGLQWSFVKYQDNQSCLDLIEGSPVSVFSLLNEVWCPSSVCCLLCSHSYFLPFSAAVLLYRFVILQDTLVLCFSIILSTCLQTMCLLLVCQIVCNLWKAYVICLTGLLKCLGVFRCPKAMSLARLQL